MVMASWLNDGKNPGKDNHNNDGYYITYSGKIHFWRKLRVHPPFSAPLGIWGASMWPSVGLVLWIPPILAHGYMCIAIWQRAASSNTPTG
jgi:hypothetical protein